MSRDGGNVQMSPLSDSARGPIVVANAPAKVRYTWRANCERNQTHGVGICASCQAEPDRQAIEYGRGMEASVLKIGTNRALAGVLVCAGALLGLSRTYLAQSPLYTTTFPLTENPISEGGKWINGGATAGANLWGNLRTTPGLAFGVSEPTQFGDPTAVLTGAWSADQSAQATVKVTTTPTTCCHEAEVRLRTTISASRITGYEVYCSLVSSDRYCHIASWGGSNGVWVNMDNTPPAIFLKNGDVLKGTVTGTNPVIITMFINGAQVLQVQDTGNFTFSDGRKYGPWPSGSPGIGFYDNQDNNWSSFGFSSFTAQNLGTGTPPATPTGLKISGQ
jgi:hypothetical protein